MDAHSIVIWLLHLEMYLQVQRKLSLEPYLDSVL